jgi:hypothetical protein
MANVQTCSVSPSTIALGGQSNLTVTLDAPAPPGGLTVLVDTDFNGSQDTLLNTPQSLGVFQGQSSSTFLLQTQVVDNPATQIIFSAHVGSGPPKAAQLNIT